MLMKIVIGQSATSQFISVANQTIWGLDNLLSCLCFLVYQMSFYVIRNNYIPRNTQELICVTRAVSPLPCHQSCVTSTVSPVPCHQRCVTSAVSPVPCHQCCVTSAVSPVLCHGSTSDTQVTSHCRSRTQL